MISSIKPIDYYNATGNLNNPIRLILKEVVSRLDVLQLEAVGDQRQCIDLVCFNEGENLGTVAAVEPARPELL